MKWYAMLACALALLASPVLAAAPRCSDVQRVTPVLDGRYHDAQCPEGTVRTVVAPALGPARVEHTPAGRGRPARTTLIDIAGARLPVVAR